MELIANLFETKFSWSSPGLPCFDSQVLPDRVSPERKWPSNTKGPVYSFSADLNLGFYCFSRFVSTQGKKKEKN